MKPVPLSLNASDDQTALIYGAVDDGLIVAYATPQDPDADDIVVRVVAIDASDPLPEGQNIPSRVCVHGNLCPVDPCFGAPPPPPPPKRQSLVPTDAPPGSDVVTDLSLDKSRLTFDQDDVTVRGGAGPLRIFRSGSCDDLAAVKSGVSAWMTEVGAGPNDSSYFHVYKVASVLGDAPLAVGDCLLIPVIPVTTGDHA